ncbi:voltage-dependent calcium channel type A subunit alpha-1-like isoform X2 [Coccinella septempunctata]|uniref:voltage-dependent calcium channel type A subunit alpha-1-like isoform X2 n=1 Tax=Coccinella septempunctata TaxID=41139 RepID=UPI001D07AA2E|nr:voltage-dependent calcium channel type A subunit alpha-1-like isoform X2 [Coccinella septempunctata]
MQICRTKFNFPHDYPQTCYSELARRKMMLGGVAGRHMSNRRKGSAIMRSGGDDFSPSVRYARRRRAVTTMDHKTCALIQTRLKLGDIM